MFVLFATVIDTLLYQDKANPHDKIEHDDSLEKIFENYFQPTILLKVLLCHFLNLLIYNFV